MTTYLLAWNPDKWQWDDIENDIALITEKGFCADRWSSGVTRKIQPNDRIFLIKLGRQTPRGIVASGWATSEVTQDIHWQDISRLAYYVDIHFDTIINPSQESIFPIERLQEGIFARVNWTPRASGKSIPEDVAEQLETDWAKFLNREIPVIQTVYPDEIDNDRTFQEGTHKLVTVNVYERNPEARAICIQRYGVVCSVCGIDFKKKYGDIGKGFIHVHHLEPLAIRKGYELNPIRDLRPVCPNCHAMLHKRKPEPYTIDELKNLVKANIA